MTAARKSEPGAGDELARLRAENARLIALLASHGIDWRLPAERSVPLGETESSTLSTGEKAALFQRLFHGRTDVFPIRWESKRTRPHPRNPSRYPRAGPRPPLCSAEVITPVPPL